MSAPLDAAPSAEVARPEAALSGMEAKRIEGRSLGQIAWMRFKRDKIAMVSGVVIVLLILFAVLAPVLNHILGVSPTTVDINAIDPNTGLPLGHFGGISSGHPFGVEPVLGRDLFARIDIGARYSLLVALLATILSVGLGTVLGTMAGFFGGHVDTLLSRLMDTLLAFPQLLFAIALVAVLSSTTLGSSLNAHLLILIIVIGFFSWPYFGRIIRGQTLSLREKEFVDAARGLGATSTRILFRELLPNLWGPILVYSTLIIPTNILFEAALSYLGVGIPPPNPSWGNILSDASNGFYNIDPMFFVIPGMAIFITVMAFNLLGDGLRDALDPRASR